MNRISLKELEKVFSLVLEKLEFYDCNTIELEQDLYREIPTSNWKVTGEKVEYIGSLQDDLEALKKLANDKERPTTFVDFDRVANVLKAISQELNPPE